MPPEEKDDIERLKHKLYSRANKNPRVSDVRAPLEAHESDTPVAWQKEEEPSFNEPKRPMLGQLQEKTGMSAAAKFLLGSLGFFVIASAAAAYIFFGGGNIVSPQNIDLQIIAPSLIDSGKTQTLQILITNRNASSLNLVDLVLDYPDGTRSAANQTQTLQHERQSIGTVAAGQQIKRTADAIFYGGEGAQEKVMATLEYSISGSNAVFEKQTELDFVVGSSPISLSVSAPDNPVAGQTFPIDITVQSNATSPIDNVVVQGQYPFGYSFASSQPQAGAGGTFWRIGTLQPGTSQVIHLVGSIDGSDGDSRVFRFLVGSNVDPTDTTIKVPLLTVPQTITVKKPFITGIITINGQTGKTIAVPAGQILQGNIQWQNTLATGISNVQLTVTFSGPALDKNSITSTTGFYQSQNSSITWTSAQDPSLASVPPGGQGTLQFAFNTLPAGAGNVLITNPTITVNLTVQGTQVGGDATQETVSSAAQAIVSVASNLSLAAQALHFSGAFQNSGPMPPVAEKDTSYTIVWTVKNSSNDIANATVSTVLPTYVRFASAGQSGVSYDSGSRTVTWNVGDLKAGVGYTTAAKQAAFQVVLNPSISQVGSVPQLTGQTLLSGQDRFAQVNVQATVQAPTTQLTGDSGFSSGMDVVAPK